MKASIFVVATVFALMAVVALPAQAGPITAGNLVVVRVGTGANALNSESRDAFIEEYTTAGAAVQAAGTAIPLPIADGGGGNQTLTISGSGVEGFIKQSTDNNYLTVGGYDTAPGTAAVAGTTSAAVNRVVGVVPISTGVPNTTTAFNNAHSGSNIRGAVSTNGTDLWTGGGGNGVTYGVLGATTSVRVNTGAGTGSTRRAVDIFGGQLYVSGASTGGPDLSLNTVGTGTPTAAGASESTLPGMPIAGTHSVYDFWFKDANTVYLTDDGTAANGGGIQKWTLSAGTWSLQYILLNNQTSNAFPTNGTVTTPMKALTGYVDGISGNAVLFATTATAVSANALVTVTDTGAGALATTLVTAATNQGFRGVEFINPVPEPASLGLLALGGLMMLRRSRKVA